MFPQTSLDHGLQRVVLAERRAELLALHRPPRSTRTRVERPCCPGARLAACCA